VREDVGVFSRHAVLHRRNGRKALDQPASGLARIGDTRCLDATTS
jgi:hypothetical protein